MPSTKVLSSPHSFARLERSERKRPATFREPWTPTDVPGPVPAVASRALSFVFTPGFLYSRVQGRPLKTQQIFCVLQVLPFQTTPAEPREGISLQADVQCWKERQTESDISRQGWHTRSCGQQLSGSMWSRSLESLPGFPGWPPFSTRLPYQDRCPS